MSHRRWVLLSDGAQPTEDIYFLRVAAPWLKKQGASVHRVDTRRWRSPGLCWPWLRHLLRGAHVLLCRSLAPAWLSWLERHRHELASLRYLIDDDIPAAAADAHLPTTYRQRMGNIADHLQPRILALVDEVVVSSELLAARLRTRHRCVSVLTPPLVAPLPDLDHFHTLPWCIGYHGTRAHLQDLEHIVPALVALHEGNESLSLEVMMGQHSPSELTRLPRVATPAALSWARFRDYQQVRRIHIGVSPLWPTPFNAGKSFIKFLDIAAMGGVGIYSHREPYTTIVSDGEDGLLAGDSPQEWLRCLQRLLDAPDETRHMAERAAEKARDIGSPARAQAFWWARR